MFYGFKKKIPYSCFSLQIISRGPYCAHNNSVEHHISTIIPADGKRRNEKRNDLSPPVIHTPRTRVTVSNVNYARQFVQQRGKRLLYQTTSQTNSRVRYNGGRWGAVFGALFVCFIRMKKTTNLWL